MSRLNRITVTALAAVLAAAPVAVAAVPTEMTVQGKLTDPGGTPQTGTFTFTFRIYDQQTGGTDVWTGGTGESQSVTTNADGLWTARIGTISALTDAVFAATERWLEVTVDDGAGGNPTETLPRMKLNTNAYSYRISTVDGASGGTITSKVSIGFGHTNVGNDGFVAGYNNTLSGDYSAIGGGEGNQISGSRAVIGGGFYNATAGSYSTVGGGSANNADGYAATVSGGSGNTARNEHSTVGGGRDNRADTNFATVGGGDQNRAGAADATVGGGLANEANGLYSGVAGGTGNLASGLGATVGGGTGNQATSQAATVVGGSYNTATNQFATVCGGLANVASGQLSWAGGYSAKANDVGAFVWADANFQDFPPAQELNFTPGPNNFLVRATGGVVFVTAIDPLFGESLAGVQLASGGGSWAALSDERLKENYEPVDGAQLLEKLASIPIGKWNYLAQDDSIRHIGPMAQDFHAAFGVGEDDRHITTIDADGVALAAIQELYRRNRELEETVESLKRELLRIRSEGK